MRPPRLASWLLARVFDRDAGEAILGDLTERWAARRQSRGAIHARVWFWRQTLRSIASVIGIRLSRSPVAGDPDAQWPAGARAGAGLVADVRYALRTLRRSPGFTLAAVATLAIGIGAATAIGTAASRTLLGAVPYPHGDRLVFLGHPNPDGSVGNVGFLTVADWRSRLKTFDELAIVRGWTPTLVGPSGASQMSAMRVSWNYFRMIGVRPALGRDFTPEDDTPEGWRVIVISDALWRRQFGARPGVVGEKVEFNGRPYEIVGVMPAGFEPVVSSRFFTRAEIWGPLGYGPTGDSSCRTCQHLKLVGRLAPDVTLDRARTELASVHAGLRREHPSDYTESSPAAVSLAREIAKPVHRPLSVLVAAVLFVLLVASANVAGLLLVRGSEREPELALRSALGAGRSRLVRQLVVESTALAAVSAALGLGLAYASLTLLASRSPVALPRLDGATTDPQLALMAVATAALALLIFSAWPAVIAARPNLQAVLRTTRQSSSRRITRVRELLLAGQVAVALVLVAGAGLMSKTVGRLLAVDPGFDPRGVISAGMSLVGPAWAEDAAVRVFQDDLLRRVASMPGVEAAALSGQIPLGDNYDRWGFRIEGRTLASAADAPELERYSVTPGYFRVMRIPLREGRLIADTDTPASPLVLLINETAAKRLWPGESPLGARVRLGGPDGPLRTIVGVVGDVRHYELGAPPTPQMYLPQTQRTDSFLVLVARTTGDPAELVAPVRAAVTSLARDVPVYDVATLENRLSSSVATRTFLMFLLWLFGATTVLMATVGLYGVVSYAVASRRREFGIRRALGARRADISWLVLRGGGRSVVAGLAFGLALSVFLGRALGTQLYETTAADPVALGSGIVALLAAAALAHLAPIRRATSVDPAETLRDA
jgi:putative ABC transport system permease protein